MDKMENAEFAWPKGDRPENHNKTGVNDTFVKELGKIFNRFINEKITFLASIVPYTSPSIIGRFLVETSKNKYFMRVSKRVGDPTTEKAIIDFLSKEKAPVNPLLISEIISWDSAPLRIDIRPYIDARFFNESDEDLIALGEGLGDIHRLLKAFKDTSSIKQNSIKRYRDLGLIKKKMEENDSILDKYPTWKNENPFFLKAFTDRFDPFYHLKDNSGPIHGEVHPGNVLFEKKFNKICFIDFEESVHSFAPKVWDVGFVVQRFILHDHPNPDDAERKLEIFESGYGDKLPELFDIMEQITFFSIAIIFDLISKGIYTHESELFKFTNFFKDIHSYKELLR